MGQRHDHGGAFGNERPRGTSLIVFFNLHSRLQPWSRIRLFNTNGRPRYTGWIRRSASSSLSCFVFPRKMVMPLKAPPTSARVVNVANRMLPPVPDWPRVIARAACVCFVRFRYGGPVGSKWSKQVPKSTFGPKLPSNKDRTRRFANCTSCDLGVHHLLG